VRALLPDSVFIDGDRRAPWERIGFERHPYEAA
jgi:hypothetical protein